MANKYKVVIQFDGHGYFGWQIQNQSSSSPTVQEIFNKALKVIFKEAIKTIASGRTDTGVHSLAHHVVFEAPFEIPTEKLLRALNSNLPSSIRAIACEFVDEKFRPTYDAKDKEYRYFFSNKENQSPFTRHYMSNISYSLDLDLMEQACRLFVGTHDFKRFHCVGSQPSSTTREIFEIQLFEEVACFNGIIPEHYSIRIRGNGFLKQMVRLIVGAVWSVGRGKLSLSEIELALSCPNGEHVSAVAPPEGLFKFSVQY